MSAAEMIAPGATGGRPPLGSVSVLPSPMNPSVRWNPPAPSFPDRPRRDRRRTRAIRQGQAPTLLATVRRWRDLARQRRRLRVLASDPDLLGDIGISRVDALQEAGKPFWKD